MKKLFVITALGATFLLGGFSALAQTTTSGGIATDPGALQIQLEGLLQQINQLQSQIAEMQKSNASLSGDVQQIKQVLQLTKPLSKGMSGDEVKLLQNVLATDPGIFSKDNTTGYFGGLTEKAVKSFQEHFGIASVGRVGPQTMAKINELLNEHNIVSELDLSENILGGLGGINNGVASTIQVAPVPYVDVGVADDED